jgi:hypothetical protein
MLDLGFPPGARSTQDGGATALHLAAAARSIATIRLLLERGADIEARDTTWDSTPLEWAIVGSGLRLPCCAPAEFPANPVARRAAESRRSSLRESYRLVKPLNRLALGPVLPVRST